MDSFDSPHKKDEGSVENVLDLLNNVIILLNIENPRVSALQQIPSNIYTTIFDKIFGYRPVDIILAPKTVEDESHNVQCIIDTLSLDILGISLSHITGEDVVSRKPLPLYHLLEIINKFVLNDNMQGTSPGRSSISIPVLDTAGSLSASNESHQEHFCPVCEYAKSRAAFSQQSSRSSPCSLCSAAKSQTHSGETKPTTVSQNGITSVRESVSGASRTSQKTKGSETLGQVEPPNKRYKPGTPFNEILAQKLMENLERIKNVPEFEDSTMTSKTPLNDLYKSVFKQQRHPKKKTPSKATSVLLPRYLKKRRSIPLRSDNQNKTRSLLTSSSRQGIVAEIENNVPGAHLSRDGLRCLEIQQQRQVKFLASRMAATRNRIPASERLLQENILKQGQLADIAQKDLTDQGRLREVKSLRGDRLRAQGAITDHTIAKARVKRYFDQYHQQHRKKLAARNAKEEMILHDLYKHRLSLQKQQMIDVAKDLRSQEKEEAENLKKRLASLDKFYEDQSELQKASALEKNVKEKTRIKAQSQELEHTRRAILKQIETEVKEIQANLEGTDDFHFVQSDAERLKERWAHPR